MAKSLKNCGSLTQGGLNLLAQYSILTIKNGKKDVREIVKEFYQSMSFREPQSWALLTGNLPIFLFRTIAVHQSKNKAELSKEEYAEFSKMYVEASTLAKEFSDANNIFSFIGDNIIKPAVDGIEEEESEEEEEGGNQKEEENKPEEQPDSETEKKLKTYLNEDEEFKGYIKTDSIGLNINPIPNSFMGIILLPSEGIIGEIYDFNLAITSSEKTTSLKVNVEGVVKLNNVWVKYVRSSISIRGDGINQLQKSLDSGKANLWIDGDKCFVQFDSNQN